MEERVSGLLYAIPDIHGRLDLLQELLLSIPLAKDDKMIFLGDYVDRGPNPAGVIRLLRDFQSPQVICLAGNHEWLMIDALTHGLQTSRQGQLWAINGAGTTMKSYAGNLKQMEEDARWLASLPLSHEEPGFFFSHAPVHDAEMLPYRREALTWNYWELHEEEKFGKRHEGRVGVCGHIHRLQEGLTSPRFYDHYLYLDCGCGCRPEAPLVAVEVRSRTVYQVSQRGGLR